MKSNGRMPALFQVATLGLLVCVLPSCSTLIAQENEVVTCLGNLRRIGTAYAIYVDTWDGFIPFYTSTQIAYGSGRPEMTELDAHGKWKSLLLQTGAKESDFFCPSAKPFAEEVGALGEKFSVSSYADDNPTVALEPAILGKQQHIVDGGLVINVSQIPDPRVERYAGDITMVEKGNDSAKYHTAHGLATGALFYDGSVSFHLYGEDGRGSVRQDWRDALRKRARAGR